jgi:hypothetical protein
VSQKPKAKSKEAGGNEGRLAPAEANGTVAANSAKPNLEDPRLVMSLLEADQVVAAKTQSHFGHRKLSAGVRAMLWGLRIYVILMLVIVLISVIQALKAAH